MLVGKFIPEKNLIRKINANFDLGLFFLLMDFRDVLKLCLKRTQSSLQPKNLKSVGLLEQEL